MGIKLAHSKVCDFPPKDAKSKEMKEIFQLYLLTVRYLEYSNTAKGIMDYLANEMDEEMLIVIGSGEECPPDFRARGYSQWLRPRDFMGRQYGVDNLRKVHKGGVLLWWAKHWSATANGWQTPAITLIHEMGHAYQYFNVKGYKKLIKQGDGKSYEESRAAKQVEDHNLLEHEMRVTSELSKNRLFFEATKTKYDERDKVATWNKKLATLPLGKRLDVMYSKFLHSLQGNIKIWDMKYGNQYRSAMKTINR